MFTGRIDNEVVDQFCGELKTIINLEMQLGNVICETFFGDWPYPKSRIVFLEKPFLTPIRRDLNGIEFRNVNDSHYWKAEYFDSTNNQILCCKFGEITDFSDM